MTYEEAVRALGPEGVRAAAEIAASLPPLTESQVEALATLLHSADQARRHIEHASDAA